MIMQPAPATQELADDLDAYLARRRKLTPFEKKALENKVKALKGKIDFAEYYTFLGLIAALSQDAEKVTYNFENALKIAPSDTMVSANYLIALNQIGWHLQALTLGKTLLKKPHNNDRLLSELIASACFLGRFHEAFELLSQLADLKQCLWYPLVIEAVKIADLAQLSDDEAEHLQQLAFSILQDHKLYLSNSLIGIVNDFIHYEIYVDLPIAQIPALDFELSLKFAEQLENMRDDVIEFEYKSVETLER